MARSSLAAFAALWRAYGEGRLERSLDLLAEQCEVTFLDGTSTLYDHDDVRAWLAAERRQWKTISIAYDEVDEPAPGCVLGIGRLHASSVDGGTEIDRELAFVAEFAGGRLVRGRMFGNRAAATRYVETR